MVSEGSKSQVVFFSLFFIRLKDELVHLILKISVKEACVLLRRCQQDTSEEFEDIISTVPVSHSII